MDQIKNNGVMGALFMNGDTIPPLQGYPLRMLVPGYYGVKQPMWVVAMKVTDQPLTDYWSDRGWDVSPPIPINSKIFFPLPGTTYKTGDTVRIGGCAYGGKRAETVEITNDEGASWQKADIVKSIDADDVWVFWLAQLIAPQPGTLVIQVRATDIHGAAQPRTDTDGLNGTNSWPALSVSVIADSAR
jgi:DMSO/TMAO reductase YedYZ molybdopterin-dependent catalytic subunit